MALTPEEQAELQQLEQQYVASQQPSLEDTTFGDRFGRGVDLLQATSGRAAQAFSEVVGADNLAKAAEDFALRQELEADLTAPQAASFGEDAFSFIGNSLVEGLPSIGALGAGAGTGAAIGSVVPVIGTGVGALAGLGLTAFGLNLGTAKEIEEALNPEGEAGLDTVAYSALATVPDLLFGGALSQTAKQGIKNAGKQVIAKKIAADTGLGVGGAVANQAVLDVGATLASERDFDQERIDTVLDNLANTAIISSVASPALSTTSAATGRLLKMREDDVVESSPYKLNEEGDVTIVEPNPEAISNPNALKKAVSTIGIGRSVDEMIALDPDNLTVRDFAADLDTTFDERIGREGRRTINTEAQLNKGRYAQTIGKFELDNLSKAERARVKQDVISGVKSPEAEKFRSGMRQILEEARQAGIYMGDLGPTYYPFMADITKIKADRKGFIDDMVTNSTVKDKDKFRRETVIPYVNKLLDEGSDLHLGKQSSIPDELLSVYEEYVDKGGSEAAKAEIIKKLSKPNTRLEVQGKVDKNNSLEQHRKLSSVPAETLENWSKDIDLTEMLDMYTQSVGERIAYANRLGANNEKLHGIVRLAQLEGMEKGKPLSVEAVEKMYNLADLQQRITAKRVSPEYKDRVRAIKTGVNVLTLPLATLSSLVEPLFIAPKTGAKPFVKGGMRAVETSARKLARTFIKDIPKSEFENALVGMNTGFREAFGTISARFGEDTLNPSKVDQTLFKYNLLAAWTEFSRMWAQGSAIEMFKQDAAKLNDPTVSPAQKLKAAQRLGEAGVDPNRVVEWERKGSDMNSPEADDLKAAAINLAEDVVFNPKPVSKPTWMSDPTWYKQLFGQLKTFPISFTNKLAIPVANRIAQSGMNTRTVEQTLKTVTVAALMTTGFVMQDALKSVVRNGDLEKWEEKSPEERIGNALMQLGATSMFADPLASELHGGSAVETIAGPTAGRVAGVTQTIAKVIAGETTPEEFVERLMLNFLPNVPLSGQIREELKN